MTQAIAGQPVAEPARGRRRHDDATIAALARKARDGSLPCFAELIRRFEGKLLNFLLRQTRSLHDAEDLAQETFVRAWQRIEQYDPRWRFSTWLYTIARRLASTHRRRQRRDITGLAEDAASREDDPAIRLADREHADLLWDIADRVLSDTQRTALWLRYAEDLAPREIARILGRSQIAIRVMLHRARETLARHGEEGAAIRRREPQTRAQPFAGELTC